MRKIWLLLALFALHLPAAEIVPGEWNSDIFGSLEYAEKARIPLVYYFGTSDCGYCSRFRSARKLNVFVDWMKTRQYIMVAIDDGTASEKREASNPTRLFPYFRVYWKQPNGTVIDERFSGRPGEIPGTSTSSLLKGETLVAAIMKAVDNLVGTYKPTHYQGGEFAVGENTAIEVEFGATEALIPLTRMGSSVTETGLNTLVVNGATQEVSWAAGEIQKDVMIPLPTGLSVGDTVKVDLIDALAFEPTLMGTRTVKIVSPVANSVDNPYWLDEKTAETLGWGEWTMDLEVAKQKVAATSGAAYTLVCITGTLWCPWCQGLANGVFNTVDFAEWARKNQVALVNIDNPKRSASDVKDAQGNLIEVGERNDGPAPTLLRYEVDSNGLSGASYLTRKRILRSDAETVLQRNHDLGYHTYLAPETLRTGYPTLVLLRKDGTIAGRFNACSDAQQKFDTAENLARLGDLLKLAEGGDERNQYPTTTALTISAEGKVSGVNLQINERSKVFRVHNLSASSTVTFSAIGAKPVQLRLYRANSTFATGELLASGQNTVAYRFDGRENSIWLEVSAYGDSAAKFGPNTDFTVDVSGTVKLHPGELSFTTATLRTWDRSDLEITVSRTGGSAGEAIAKITAENLGALTPGRCEWRDVELRWADGEAGEKKFTIHLTPQPGLIDDETFAVKLTSDPSSDCPVAGIASQSITVYGIDAPALAKSRFDIRTAATFGISLVEPVYCVDVLKNVKLNIVSGRMPSGLKLAYDKKQGVVTVKGSSRKAVSAQVVFSLSERRGRETVVGPEVVLNIVIEDPADRNAYVLRNKTVELPMLSEGALAGLLTVTQTTSGKVKAKLISTAKKNISFSGSWLQMDDDGVAWAELTTSKDEKLKVKLLPTGVLTADIQGVTGALSDDYTSLALDTVNSPKYSAYKGYYTVTLPQIGGVSSVSHACGTGYLTLKMSSISSNGQFSYSGVMPNGASLSGKGRLIQTEDGSVRMVIFTKKSSETLGALMDIRANASQDYISNPMAILDAPGMVNYWMHGSGTSAVIYPINVYGGYYDPNYSLKAWCECAYETSKMQIVVDIDAYQPGSKYGAVVDVPSADVWVKEKSFNMATTPGLTIKLGQKNGLISGNVTLTSETGKKITAKYKGVLLPGWYDCGCAQQDGIIERPFASGTVFFKETVGGRSEVLGMPIDLYPVPMIE